MKALNRVLNGIALLIFTLVALFVCVAGYKAFGGIGGSFLMTIMWIVVWYIMYFLALIFLGEYSCFFVLPVTICLSIYMAFADNGPRVRYAGMPTALKWYKDHNIAYDVRSNESPMEALQLIQGRLREAYVEDCSRRGIDFNESRFMDGWNSTIAWFGTHDYPNEQPTVNNWPLDFPNRRPQTTGEVAREEQKFQKQIAQQSMKSLMDADKERFFKVHASELERAHGSRERNETHEGLNGGRLTATDWWDWNWRRTWGVRLNLKHISTDPSGFYNGPVPAILPLDKVLDDRTAIRLMFP